MPRNSRQKTRGIQARIRNTVEGIQDSIGDTRDRAEDYVRDHPVKSIIIAAGVGAAVAVGVTAFMMRSKERSFWDKLLGFF